MTESECWEEIAVAFARFEDTGRGSRFTYSGLCAAVTFESPFPLRSSMNRRLGRLRSTTNHWFPRNTEYAGLRSMYAQLCAELAKEDERNET